MVRLKKNLRLKYGNVFSMQKGVHLNHKTTKHWFNSLVKRNHIIIIIIITVIIIIIIIIIINVIIIIIKATNNFIFFNIADAPSYAIDLFWIKATFLCHNVYSRAYFRWYPHAMPFWFFLCIYQKLYMCMLFRGVSFSNCTKFAKACLFILQVCRFFKKYALYLRQWINFSLQPNLYRQEFSISIFFRYRQMANIQSDILRNISYFSWICV